MSYSIEYFDSEQVIRVEGLIDFTNSSSFSEMLARAAGSGPRVVVDLSQAEALDSGAIAELLRAYDRARDAGVEISVAPVSESVRRILWMCGVGGLFGLAPPAVADETPQRPGQADDLSRQDWQITESVAFAEDDLIASLRDLVVDAACEAGLDRQAVSDVRLAVAEALLNALSHGSPKGRKSKIRLRCLACASAFVVEVVDEGGGVSEKAIRDAGSPGGRTCLGLRLILRAMDEVEFLHDERGGRVRMLKWKAASNER